MSTKRPNKNTGRSKDFIKCWNCNGLIGSNLLDNEHYGDVCPLCEATGLRED